MKIAVVGTGYVGLVSGTCFAETGIDVACVDIDSRKIELLNNGHIPIYEPGLEDIYKKNVEKGRLTFTTNLVESIKDSDAVFIAVGTPPDEDGSAEMILVTEWSEFRSPNFKVLKKLLKHKLIFDGRNIYDPVEMSEMGFTYYGIGRKPVIA